MYVTFLKIFSVIAAFFDIFVLHCLANGTTSHIETLFNTTILATDHRYRPQLNQSEATRVNISLVNFSLMDVDEVHQSVASSVLLMVTWLDETRKWDPNQYGGITKVHPEPTDIWKPRLFLSNSIAERDVFEDDYAPLTIFNDGLTIWHPGGMLYTFCPLRMTHFPFDIQTCSLNLTTGETVETLWLLSPSSNNSFPHDDKSGEWLIKMSTVRTETVNNVCHVKVILKLQHLSSFTLLNIVIPVNIISILSSLTFLIPVDSGERVSFSVTVLLSLTVYTGEISKDLPTNSESLPLLIMYLASLLLHSGFVIVANLAVLKRHFSTSRTGNQMEVNTAGGFSFTKKLSDSSLNDNLNREQETSFAYTDNNPPKRNLLFRKHNFGNFNNATLNRRCHKAHNSKNKRTSNRLESRYEKYEFGENNTENVNESGRQLGFAQMALARVSNYTSVLDFILFLLSFILWLLITIIFMTLMAVAFL